jgi:hypothetical protein
MTLTLKQLGLVAVAAVLFAGSATISHAESNISGLDSDTTDATTSSALQGGREAYGSAALSPRSMSAGARAYGQYRETRPVKKQRRVNTRMQY